MPLVIKPRTLGLLHKVERRRDGARLILCVIAAFDLADPARLDGEQALWTMAAASLPEGSPLDMCMPKPRAEVLIGGKVDAPHADALLLEAEVGTVRKSLAVFGDRWWTIAGGAYVPTAPRPIRDLLLSPARAFGGAGHAANPAGMGFAAVERIGTGEAVQLPNIERPDRLIHAPDEVPLPAAFGPLDIMSPERQRLAGTYDAAWARDVAPALADDIHPDFFLTAPPDQRLGAYLAGDEPYRLRNFSASAPYLEGRLPGVRPRAFAGLENGHWIEAELTLDTLWLMAGARRGVLIWHGVVPVEDIEGKDVTDIMLARERLTDAPRALSHYAEVRRLRRDPELGPRYAFSEWQLTPPVDRAEEERRRAARMTLARQRAERQTQAMVFLRDRQMDAMGLPLSLRPPPPEPDPDPLPLPTPEELAEGDFDLGDLLDMIEAKSAAAQEQVRLEAEKGQPLLSAMARIDAPGAGAGELDAVLKALEAYDGGALVASLDAASAQGRADIPGLEGEADLSDAATLAKAQGALDWRATILDNLPGADHEAELEQAKARFLGLPEAAPLAEVRASLAAASNVRMPDLPPDAPPLGTPGPVQASIGGLLDAIAAEPDVPAAGAASVNARLAQADRQIAAALPGLSKTGGGSALDALLADLASTAPQVPAASPQERMSAAQAQMDDGLGIIDSLAPVLEAGTAQMRRAAPQAAYPERPLAPRIAKRFGDFVLDQARAGIDLRGRDLAGVDLAGADLSGADLTGAFLERANLARARLCGANLSEAVLTEARLEQADFSDAVLVGANLSRVKAAGARFDRARFGGGLVLDADFSGVSAVGAAFSDMRFIATRLAGADFSEARLQDLVFMRVQASEMRLDRASLRQCQALECDFSGASLEGGFLDRCAFLALTAPGLRAAQADVRGTSFLGGAKLAGADFSGGLLSEASFLGADLSGARFLRAVCDRTLFCEAGLADADFRLASLRRALLDNAGLVRADFGGAQLMEAQLHRADLSAAFLRKANLYGADLSDAVMIGADLSGANLLNSPLALETAHG
ncbi:DUF2169 family type VI secretion system accessory protein [Aquabacter cavernae]|uniref:DUF2169 family type VI secretion system accessory protein n=1 Tax=Aquabacter cavernae TaxID=2496029 RepID=UPI000F8C3673|nr:DUF2169 domain-containing protein [Aquabacter cavernae]